MSLHTLSSEKARLSVQISSDLTIQESTDVDLLAKLGTTTREEVICRLVNDHLAFVAYWMGQPAAFGWMARGKAKIGELNHEMVLPERHRYLWNFRTGEVYRGLGIYPALLQYIIRFESEKAAQFWIIHAPENKASLRGIQKAGFEPVGRLYTDGGTTLIEHTATAEIYQSALAYMDIIVSPAPAASCWNCSSPFLKKRTPACCCEAAEQECSHNNLPALVS